MPVWEEKSSVAQTCRQLAWFLWACAHAPDVFWDVARTSLLCWTYWDGWLCFLLQCWWLCNLPDSELIPCVCVCGKACCYWGWAVDKAFYNLCSIKPYVKQGAPKI